LDDIGRLLGDNASIVEAEGSNVLGPQSTRRVAEDCSETVRTRSSAVPIQQWSEKFRTAREVRDSEKRRKRPEGVTKLFMAWCGER